VDETQICHWDPESKLSYSSGSMSIPYLQRNLELSRQQLKL